MKIGDLVKMTDWLVMPSRKDTIGVVLKIRLDEDWDDKAYVWFEPSWEEWVIFRSLTVIPTS